MHGVRLRPGVGVRLALALVFSACSGAAPRASLPIVPPGAAQTPSAALASGRASNEDEAAAIPLAPDDPAWGSSSALVTIVEFADFECPFCARAAETLASVRNAYGPEKVRVVWKNAPLPFHKNARAASEAAAGVFALAGSDAFWRFYALAFAGQRDLGPETYAIWAQQAGVRDAEAFRSGLQSHAWGPKVEADLAQAKRFGVVGTPWFFINGVRLVGAQPLEAFQSVI